VLLQLTADCVARLHLEVRLAFKNDKIPASANSNFNAFAGRQRLSKESCNPYLTLESLLLVSHGHEVSARDKKNTTNLAFNNYDGDQSKRAAERRPSEDQGG
jgi:hypothetical protein